ncbi:MAG: hypothetical protein HWN81_19740 [Candidatus Lokiarchaeota archaeon]|nr:hypothetical protein [Candidatus Lokiarchaeota archaeon]
MTKNRKIRWKSRCIGLLGILFCLILSSVLLNFDKDYDVSIENSNDDFKNDVKSPVLKTQTLSSDSVYSGVGKPWNVTHYANRTDYDLSVNFANGTYDLVEIPLGIDWIGYKLDTSINNLYDTRNWNNGTFDFGTMNTYNVDENDSSYILNDFQNWTFYDDDNIVGYTNQMSGNYVDSIYAAADGHNCLELRMDGESIPGWYGYDEGDKCWWSSSISIPRGAVRDSELHFEINPNYLANFNSWDFSVSLNGQQIYSSGTYSLQKLGEGNWHSFNIPQEVWTNQSNIFSSPINDSIMSIEIALEYVADTAQYSSGFYHIQYQQIFIDNVELWVTAEPKPSQIQLKLNDTSVNDVNWGKGSLELNGNWQGTQVMANFSSEDIWELSSYTVDLDATLNLFTLKSAPETSYETNFISEGTKFSVQNNSLVNWENYAYFAVPTGYEETNMRLEFPTDLDIKWVSEPQQPSVNRLTQCDNSTAGLLLIPVNSISTTPDGFWKFEAKSPNYCEKLQIFKNTTSVPTGNDWVLETEFLSGDFINITAKITDSSLVAGYIQQTKARLQIRFPNGSIWTDINQLQSPDSNGIVDFDYFQIPIAPLNYEAGEYEVIITWNNSYCSFGLNETGIIYKKFSVIHESSLEPDQGVYFIENVIDDRVINIKVSFNDKVDDTAIENAIVYTNFSDQIQYFSEISPGFYLFEFNATEADPGNNTLTVYANASFYVNNVLNITVDVVKETTLTVETDFFTVSWNQNFTVHFNYTEKNDPGVGVNTSDISIDWVGYYLKQTSPGRYELTCNTSAYSALTLQSFIITINAYKYQAQSVLIRVQINELGSILELYLNGIKAAVNDKIVIDLYEQVNITAKYRDSLSSNHLSNASVRVVGGGLSENLTENTQLQQYSIVISGSEFGQTVDTLSLFAKKENYDQQIIPFLVEVTEKKTELQLFFNGINKTNDPLLELPISAPLNISIKYTDKAGNHMGGANVELIGDDFALDFNESITLEQYSLIIDTTKDLYIGVNILTVVAEGVNIQTKTINPRITIRRIFTEINTISGFKIINIQAGENAMLNVILNNIDFGGLIKNATVKYIWAFGTGDLLDSNDDGIYSVVLRNVPVGSYSVVITAFVNDNYFFESYEIIITAITITSDDTLFQTLFIISIIGALALGSYFVAYQKYLKYPKPVRKVRKYRKTLKRKSAPSGHIISRKTAFKEIYKDEFEKVQKLKVSPAESVEKIEKPVEKKPIEKPKEETKDFSK